MEISAISTLPILLLGLGLREPAPGHFRIREHDGGNGVRLEDRVVSGDDVHGDPRLVRRLVGEHRLARDVADREDRRLRGSPRQIDLDEPAGIDL